MFGIIILFGLLAAKPTVVRPNNVPPLNDKSS